MPILKPEIQAALREVGLSKSTEGTLSERLDQVDLSISDSLQLLSDVAHGTDNGQLRLKAVETAFRLHGVLKDQQAPIPHVTIVINDPDGPKGPNPILLPRQITNRETIQ